MRAIPGILISLLICGTAAVLEGACAGKNVKAFFATLRFPRYSAPLWVWTIIGVSITQFSSRLFIASCASTTTLLGGMRRGINCPHDDG